MIPTNTFQYYAPDYELDVRPSNMDNANSREYLDKILIQVLENMRRTIHAPSTQATEIPRESLAMNDEDEAALDDEDEDMNADRRTTQRRADKYVEKNGELSSDDEGDESGAAARLPGRDMRRARMNYRNLLDVGGDSGVETGSGMDTPLRGSSLPGENDEMDLGDEATGNPTPSPAQLNGSTAISGEQSPQPAAVDDGDVDMGDAHPAPAPPAPPAFAPTANTASTIAEGQMTPPDSPLPVPAPVQTPMTNGAGPSMTSAQQTETQAIQEQMEEEDKAIKAEEEGLMEREKADADGQARADAVAKAEDSEP